MAVGVYGFSSISKEALEVLREERNGDMVTFQETPLRSYDKPDPSQHTDQLKKIENSAAAALSDA